MKSSRNFTFMLFIFSMFTVFLVSFNPSFQVSQFKENEGFISNDLRSSQNGANFSVNIAPPKFIWLEAQFKVYIKSNQSGSIHISLEESLTQTLFSKTNQTFTLVSSNETQSFTVRIAPKLLTLPGPYFFNLNINGIISFNQTYYSILGMGYLMMFIMIGILAILFIVILARSEKSGGNKSYISPTEPESYESIEGLPSGKIQCPKCRNVIPEGLSFCPECGERIPEFLRYNPDSSSPL
ncbi:MAG: hypothetical protein GF317_24275 [Candidatus Lokiarchaeota archaeon]|nr:hypothetical protein [Candidatus Lokiarchaeota archaeon]MBD3202491.1 hypothetical protein [Candidatus Lokiarchaeota archaeon]